MLVASGAGLLDDMSLDAAVRKDLNSLTVPAARFVSDFSCRSGGTGAAQGGPLPKGCHPRRGLRRRLGSEALDVS